MRMFINALLMTVGFVFFGAAVYRSWDHPFIRTLFAQKVESSQITKILIKESEVFAIKLTNPTSDGCWYENNYDIVVQSPAARGSNALLKSLTLVDTIPSGLKMVVPAGHHIQFSSASLPVRADWKVDDSNIAISLFNLYLPTPTQSSESYELFIKPPGDDCCANTSSGSNKTHSCFQLSPGCSAAPAVRGYIEFAWQEWLDLKTFKIEPAAQTMSSNDRASYRLRIRLLNKKLKDFAVYFNDTSDSEWGEIILHHAPENFSPYGQVHRAEYHDVHPGDELSFEFDFSILAQNQKSQQIKRLVQIESNDDGLLYPGARFDGQYEVERKESHRLVFIIDAPVQSAN